MILSLFSSLYITRNTLFHSISKDIKFIFFTLHHKKYPFPFHKQRIKFISFTLHHKKYPFHSTSNDIKFIFFTLHHKKYPFPFHKQRIEFIFFTFSPPSPTISVSRSAMTTRRTTRTGPRPRTGRAGWGAPTATCCPTASSTPSLTRTIKTGKDLR